MQSAHRDSTTMHVRIGERNQQSIKPGETLKDSSQQNIGTYKNNKRSMSHKTTFMAPMQPSISRRHSINNRSRNCGTVNSGQRATNQHHQNADGTSTETTDHECQPREQNRNHHPNHATQHQYRRPQTIRQILVRSQTGSKRLLLDTWVSSTHRPQQWKL
jgi:hypothetical protein